MTYTTLKELREYDACKDRYKHLERALGNWKDTQKIPLEKILELNGLDDAIWALRAIIGKKKKRKIILSFAIACAKHVIENFNKIYPNDGRPNKAIEAAEKVLKSDTKANRAAAYSAARSAARSAYSARSAAFSADSAAYSAARSAYSARSAAFSADSAAYSAARSARSAFSAARSAAFSAFSAERKWQESKLIEIIK